MFKTHSQPVPPCLSKCVPECFLGHFCDGVCTASSSKTGLSLMVSGLGPCGQTPWCLCFCVWPQHLRAKAATWTAAPLSGQYLHQWDLPLMEQRDQAWHRERQRGEDVVQSTASEMGNDHNPFKHPDQWLSDGRWLKANTMKIIIIKNSGW